MNFEGWGVAAASAAAATSAENSASTESQRKSMTKESSIFECVYQPTQAFEVPREAFALEPGAKSEAADIEATQNLNKASQFIERYGDHISEGMQTLGGVMYLKMTTTLNKEVTESQMTAATAGSQKLSAGAGYGGYGVKGGVHTGYSEFEMSGSSAGGKDETLQQTTKFETVYFGPPIGDADSFIKCLFMNNSTWHIIDRGLSSGSFIPVWELLRAEGMPLAAATVRLAWQQRTLRTKDLPSGTLKILQDSSSVDEPPREVQATLDCFSQGLKAKMQGLQGDLQPYKLVEILGDILVFAARLEARLPANSGVMKVLLRDDLFRTLVQKVVVGTDDELKLGKALLRHVFCSVDESVNKLKTSIITACNTKEVSDFFNSDEIYEYKSTAVHPVSLSDLPDRLVHIADTTTPDQLHRLPAIAAQVVCGALCVAEDAALLKDFRLILKRYPFNFAEERGVFDFPIERDELRDLGELLRKALTPSPFVAGQRVSRTSMDDIFRVGTVCASVTASKLVKVKWDECQGEEEEWWWYLEEQTNLQQPSLARTRSGPEEPHGEAQSWSPIRFARDQPARGLEDSLRFRLGLVLNPGSLLNPRLPNASNVPTNVDTMDGAGSLCSPGSASSASSEDGDDKIDCANVATCHLCNLLLDRDPYERMVLVQQLMDLKLAAPVIFTKSSTGKSVNLLEEDVLRHVTSSVVGSNGKERTVRLAADRSLARVAFFLLNRQSLEVRHWQTVFFHVQPLASAKMLT